MNPLKTVMTESMNACMFARKDIFRLADHMQTFLSEPVDKSLQKQRVEQLIHALHVSANAGMNEYMLTSEHSAFPAYFAEGQEANWAWLDSKLFPYLHKPTAETKRFILDLCGKIRRNYEYGVPGNAEHAREIIAYLEKTYHYLSCVIGRRGLHFLAFPTVESESECFDIEVGWKWTGGVFCKGLIFAVPSMQNEFNSERFVYESVTETIIQRLNVDTVLKESGLRMLQEHWDPEICLKRPEDQVGAFYDGVLMGLSYKAPYGDFAFFDDVSEPDQKAWSAYAAQLICRAGGVVPV